MQILMNTGGIASTNCFLIADEDAKEAVLFDAPNDTVEPLLKQAKDRGWNLVGLWLTHGHFDHLADHAIVKQRFPGAKILIHQLEEPRLNKPGSDSFELPFVIPPGKADALLQNGQKLKIGSIDVDVIYTPGHSPGHVMFHLPAQRVLVGGDLIIAGAIGRTDFPDADAKVLAESVRRIMSLPDDTRLLPGHGKVSALGEERRDNPYVQMILRGESIE